MRHIIWDWNGTLFNDLHIVVNSVNASLGELGAPPIDADGYRDHYTRPVRGFYAALLGRPVSTAEFAMIDRTFHRVYASQLDAARLADGARQALGRVQAPATQSLLSMWYHDQLGEFVDQLHIRPYMQRVDGSRVINDGSKAGALAQHLAALRQAGVVADGTAVVAIGDSLDDARAAAAVGVDCVLYDGGTHHRWELESAGVPVAATLAESLDMAGIR